MEAETTPESDSTPTSKKTTQSDFITSQQEPTSQSNLQLETTMRGPHEPVQERKITKQRSSDESLNFNYMQPGMKHQIVASTIASLGVCLGIGPSNGRRKFVKCN
ncbi:uncharacterized protein [Antedon mediterranea]|uniref:uncharacterized protein n=1 Tax=Antedon mediterranea TaxID=105859 RepID=UPI003AF71DC4